MDEQYRTLESEVKEHLAGDERQDALGLIESLRRQKQSDNEMLAAIREEEKKKRLKTRLVSLMGVFPFSLFINYIALSSILSGRSPITFMKSVDYIYYESTPYLFIFSVVFLLLLGLPSFGVSLYMIITGRAMR